VRRRRTGDHNEPKTFPQPPLLRANDVAQPSTNTISHHGPADPLRGHEAGLAKFGSFCAEESKN
jgi:hypothetical protein